MTRISSILTDLLSEALKKAQNAGKLAPVGECPVSVEKPKNKQHGDLATTLPLAISKTTGGNPMSIAETLVNFLDSSDVIKEVKAHSPGFINFRLSDMWLRQRVPDIEVAKDSYGISSDRKGETAQVEFVSVNPTGPLHIGHARGAVIGSAVADLLEAVGYDVQREYYVNDAGRQFRIYNETLWALFLQAARKEAVFPEERYEGEFVNDMAKELFQQFEEDVPEGDGEYLEALKYIVCEEALKKNLEGIRSTLERTGIKYDRWFSERTLISEGLVDAAINRLRDRGYIAEREGALWFIATKLGGAEDSVVQRSGTGKPTYLGTDIAYHYDKLAVRKFDKVVNIWGADHHEHVNRLGHVVQAFGLNPSRLKILTNQIVHFKRGGRLLKMSKRKGDLILMDDLLKEVGADACRYMFMSRSPGSHMDFDFDLVKKQSSENFVYYVQYAHARLCSILEEGKKRKLNPDDGDLSLLTHPRELALLRYVAELPDVVYSAAEQLAVQRVPAFAYELARALQHFYEECRVISNDPKDAALSLARLRLVRAVRIVISNLLRLMRMSAPVRM